MDVNAASQFYRKLDGVQRARWFKLAASAVILVLAIAGFVFIVSQDPAWLPSFMSPDRMVSLLVTMAIFIGWWMLVIWTGLTLTFFLIAIGGGVIAGVFLAFGWRGLALAVEGACVLTFTFLLLMRVLLTVFRRPTPIIAIAHTVVKESVRLRLSVVFIVLLLIILPLLPLVVQTEEALRYRIQAFIQYSTGTTFYLAAFMTIFLACGTVAFEIRDRQIWQLMTKPVNRLSYLLGKWLGIVSVNFLLLLVTGVSIFMFVQYLSSLPAANAADAHAVENRVLVAQRSIFPRLEPIPSDVMRNRIDQLIENDFTLQQEIENGERSEIEVKRDLAVKIADEHSLQQRTVGPGQVQEYRFEGLGSARRMGLPIRLRFRFHYYDESTHNLQPVTFVIVQEGAVVDLLVEDYVPTIGEFVELSSESIQEDGTLVLGIVNGYLTNEGQPMAAPNAPHSLNFDDGDLEIMYPVGGFEANYFRAMLVMWVKLAFLGMVGLACATVLSFPVATLMTFTVFLAAIISPYLQLSLDQFYVESYWRIDKVVIKGIAWSLVFLFEPFGNINPTQSLVEGRVIEWWSVLRAMVLLGLVWCGLALGLGFLAFKDRELATYSGHG